MSLLVSVQRHVSHHYYFHHHSSHPCQYIQYWIGSLSLKCRSINRSFAAGGKSTSYRQKSLRKRRHDDSSAVQDSKSTSSSSSNSGRITNNTKKVNSVVDNGKITMTRTLEQPKQSSTINEYDWSKWFPVQQYRFSRSSNAGVTPPLYTREHIFHLLQRSPLWIFLVVLLFVDETSPFRLIRILGPSMIPTIAPDQSEIWLFFVTKQWLWNLVGIPLVARYKRGDLVGFYHPDHPTHVSCKRIVGLPGDKVQRYGQFVHLYVNQDPDGWGISWPDQQSDIPEHDWVHSKRHWDDTRGTISSANNVGATTSQLLAEMKRTITVPEGHVWLESDCPALGVDSRHYGPIPIEWIHYTIVAKLWPFWHVFKQPLLKRPHPIPLDEETLKQYNLHHK